ncbi:hypothetical protein [Mycobacterium xenopi]|uniref:hypothetical protein n=1 Tax=Mycobacterium xenopi TaxID=1789 RepID=UPI000A14A854|nr:hypothetical protein [Mycobacterium xenopi]ORX21141.1 hypothetical protein AWC32_02120 [Mycobacterium xenopi]SPX94826.1 Uncharacterised protein [Mycobacterium xenopi]
MSDNERLTAAEAFLSKLRQAALIAEAEDLAHGVRHLTVVTGDLETADDVARLDRLTAAAWQGREGARMITYRGGNDYVIFFIDGAAAELFVDDLAALAETLDPGWWRIVRSPHPF